MSRRRATMALLALFAVAACGERPEAAAAVASGTGVAADTVRTTGTTGTTAARDSNSAQVVMLGTGTPNADPDRSGPSVAIVVNGKAYLVDCGPGVVRRAAAARRNGIAALAPEKLGIVFITHLHSDHTLGLPDLMLTPWVLERREPLKVYGPPGTRAMADHLLAAYAEDIRVRIEGLEPEKTDGWQVHTHEIAAGPVYRDTNVKVTAFAVPHANWRHAFGYRFETRDRVIVVSGDTRPSDAVVSACDGCDILVHEVYSADRFATRPPEWQRYHADAHTSTTELAALATRAKPRLLVLYHQLFWGTDDEGLVREVRRGYEGAVVSGRDLEVYR
ncbi:MAG: MBL fold metallo-hydrolase [Candidatus Eisenbacteria bacterium]